MRIGFISDLHLHSEKRVSENKMDDETLLSRIKAIKEQVDVLHIDGDIIESHQPKWFSVKSTKKLIEAIKNKYPQTIKYITNSSKIILHSGNHDFYFERRVQLDYNPHRIYDIGNDKFAYISHGAYDYLNSNHPLLAQFITFVFGWLKRITGFSSIIGKIVRKLSGANLFQNSKQIKYMRGIIDINDSLVLFVNGHTHLKEYIKFNYNGKERIYINCGKFQSKNKPDYTIVDTEKCGKDISGFMKLLSKIAK